MKRWFCALVMIGGLAVSVFSQGAFQHDFMMKRGTNISHWLSQSQKRGEARKAYFTREDVKYLAGLGLDHIRIPIDEEQMWDEQGNKETEAFELLNNALDWCAEFQLRALVDLHILRSHHFNNKERPLWTQASAQETFFQCWRDLSDAMKNRPLSMVAYEIMNEPVADEAEDWNRLIAKVVKVIRDREPQRIIFVGSNKWQSAGTFDQLRVPENDPNIVLSFHMYSPMPLTHYKASWTGVGKYTGPVKYPGVTVKKEDVKSLDAGLANSLSPGKVYNRDSFVEIIQKPLRVAKKYNLPLYCGEWGCLKTVDQASRVRWYADVKSVFEEHGIAWTTWDYKGGFGLRNSDGSEDRDVIDVLFGKK